MATHPTDLDRLHVRFATFRDSAVDGRAADARRFAALAARERVLLETCHRVELVTVEDEPSSIAERRLSGRDAVTRVFEVVAGFDSAVAAEEQLIGQVREAYASALAAGTSGPILNELLRRALRFGRRVRSHVRPGTDRSLADRGAAWLDSKATGGSRALVAGTGEMGRSAAAVLARCGRAVTVVSRSAERGRALRRELPGTDHALAVGGLTPALVADHGAICLAVRRSAPLLAAEHLDARRQPHVLDLSVPSAVSEAARAVLGDRLMDVDRLGGLSGTAAVLEPAVERRLRSELDQEVNRFVDWLASRRATDAVALLHGEADAVRRRHLDRLRKRADLAPEQLAAVEAASAAMLGELLHGPMAELKRGGADAATVRRLFGLEA